MPGRREFTRCALGAIAGLLLVGGIGAQAAGIEFLRPTYTGITNSTIHSGLEGLTGILQVQRTQRQSFQGVFVDGGLVFAINGGVSTRGDVVFTGRLQNGNMRVDGRGKLGADGITIVGTGKETGILDGRFFRDDFTFCLVADGKEPDAPGRTKQ